MINKKTANHIQFLTFCLDNEIFATEVLRAREVLSYTEPTKVPKMPPELLGVINLRGKVVPVIDLRCKFDMPSAERTRDNCIIILEVLIDGDGALVFEVGLGYGGAMDFGLEHGTSHQTSYIWQIYYSFN